MLKSLAKILKKSDYKSKDILIKTVKSYHKAE